MRKIEPTDLEAANYEYIEFWLMDPFVYDQTAEGGDLYFNLGEISEDILKDEKKFFENGLPVDGDLSKVDTQDAKYGLCVRQPEQAASGCRIERSLVGRGEDILYLYGIFGEVACPLIGRDAQSDDG